MSEKAEKLYSKLREKYKQLPDFKKLDFEFEITSIQEKHINECYFSRAVRRRIYEKVYYFNGALVTIIAPQVPSIILAHEHKFITSDDRDKIMGVIKKLTKIEREHLLLETEFDEAKDADFIKNSFALWLEVKPSVIHMLKIMRDSWEKNESFKIGDYFG